MRLPISRKNSAGCPVAYETAAQPCGIDANGRRSVMVKIPGLDEARLCAILRDLDAIIGATMLDPETAHRAIRLKWRLQGYDPTDDLESIDAGGGTSARAGGRPLDVPQTETRPKKSPARSH